MRLLTIITLLLTPFVFADEIRFLSVTPFKNPQELNWERSVLYVGTQKELDNYKKQRKNIRKVAPYKAYEDNDMLIIEFFRKEDEILHFETFRKPVSKNGETRFIILGKEYKFKSIVELLKLLKKDGFSPSSQSL